MWKEKKKLIENVLSSAFEFKYSLNDFGEKAENILIDNIEKLEEHIKQYGNVECLINGISYNKNKFRFLEE